MPADSEALSRTRSWLLRHARRLSGTQATAEDLVQEALLRFLVTFPDASERLASEACAAWLLSVAMNCFYTQCRQRGVRERYAADPALIAPQEATAPDWKRISSEQLTAAIQALRPAQRSAIQMKRAGRGNPEIARELGISRGAAAKRLFDGRLALQATLEAVPG
jgi:RNA polymerase sigma factor (sigma-70 family)